MALSPTQETAQPSLMSASNSDNINAVPTITHLLSVNAITLTFIQLPIPLLLSPSPSMICYIKSPINTHWHYVHLSTTNDDIAKDRYFHYACTTSHYGYTTIPVLGNPTYLQETSQCSYEILCILLPTLLKPLSSMLLKSQYHNKSVIYLMEVTLLHISTSSPTGAHRI